MDPDDYSVAKSKKARQIPNPAMKWLPAGLIAFVLLIGGFAAGMQYQKGKTSSASTTSMTASAGRFGGQNGMRRAGGIGTVTAVSSSSITVTPRSFGPTSGTDTTASKTYAITSSTAITDSGATVDYTDIKAGDMVIVQTSSTTSMDATTIDVNPSAGGGFGGQGTPPTTTQTNSSTTDPSAPTSSI